MLHIVTYPHPILKSVADPVNSIGKDEKRLFSDMIDVMYRSEGIGLAAPQISVSKRLIVLDCGDGKIYKLANPEIVPGVGLESCEEGCLSLPGVVVEVKRPKIIRLKAVDENGEVVELEADGLLARALQHEVDHLNGVTIADYLDPMRRFFRTRDLRRGH